MTTDNAENSTALLVMLHSYCDHRRPVGAVPFSMLVVDMTARPASGTGWFAGLDVAPAHPAAAAPDTWHIGL